MDDQNFLLKHKEDSITDSNTDNSQSQALPKQELKTYVTKIDDIDLPSVIIKDIDSYENKGWREKTANLSDYFNYGFNEETWKKYSEKIMRKLNELKKAVDENRISLIQKDLIKYLFNLPADYGGIGEILDEKKFENLNFFEYKPSKNKQLPTIEVRQGSMCVTLERNENIIINYNPPTNVNNFSSINSNITGSTNFPVIHPNLKSLPPVILSTPMTPFFNPPFLRPHGMEIPMSYQFFLQRPVDYERTLNITNISQYSPYFNLKTSEEKPIKERRDQSVSSKNSERKKRKKDKKKKHKRSRSTSRERSRSKKRSKNKRSRSRSKDRSRRDKKRY